MPKDRVTDLLEEFVALTRAAARPESPARRTAMRNRLPAGTLTGAALIVVAVAVLGIVAGRPAPSDLAGASATPSASSGPVAIASPAPLASTEPSTPTATPTERPTPTLEPTVGPCDPADLATRITLWEGAAGSRIADVELVNRGRTTCLLEALDRPQLVSGDGSVRIDGVSPASTDVLTVQPGDTLRTLVSFANDCKPATVPPISVAFVFSDGRRLIADPVSPTDSTVPTCLGPGQPASIDMHPWAP